MSVSRRAPPNLGQVLQEAVALQQQGRLREAEKIYTRVLKTLPDQFDALNLLGTIKAQRGQAGEAHRLITAALKVNPRAPDAWVNLGIVLHALKRDQEALERFDKALELKPGDADALHQRANALLALGRAQDALSAVDQVLALIPRHPQARLNRGLALAALERHGEALAEFDGALALLPGNPAAHYNRGISLFSAGRYEEAVASFSRALEIRKDYADAHFNQALALLTIGDFRRGFEKYEWRWRRTGMPAHGRSYGRPLWLGEYPLQRKTILLHAEQGLGDTIQFARYVPLLARAGAKVVLEVQAQLAALLGRLEGAASVVARGEPLPPFDVHCPLGSLPLALKTEPATIPAEASYLKGDDARIAKWRARIGALERPRVALAWAGNAQHINDRNRSITLSRLASPWSAASPRFIGIQRELRGEDGELLAREPRVMQIGAELDDFADTAAVIALVDLVVSVDTSVAHLAGAMGRPVWILLPFSPDWRWALAGESSPWYPTARLFRQPTFGDWDSVIERVRRELDRFVREGRDANDPQR